MADAIPPERLQPSLLDRLTDDAPANQQIEPAAARILSRSQLRAAVLRDLGHLMNATCLGASQPLDDWPDARASVINYGMPSFAGETAATLDIAELERAIRDAILRFEPRILAETLEVEAITHDSVMGWHNVVSCRISGQIWAQPMPLEMMLRTEVDLETGQVSLTEIAR